MLSRRSFVGRLAAGATVACAAGIGRAEAVAAHGKLLAAGGEQTGQAAASDASAVVPDVASPAPWELLSPLAQGADVGHGWRVGDLSAVVDGSCVLTLKNQRGRTHRIHLCRNDGTPQGLVYTARTDLIVMNGGQGDLPTEEGLAQAVATVAHVLAANEGLQEPVLAALLPHTERLSRFTEAAQLR